MSLAWHQSLTGRTLLQIAVAVGVILAVATGAAYHLVLRAVEERELLHMDEYVGERAKREEAYFTEIATNLQTVTDAFLERWRQPDPPGFLDQWDRWFERCPDGAVRSRREYSDTYRYATLWVHKDTVLTPELKRRVLVQFEICQRFIAGWAHGFRSLYAFTPELTNVGFDPLIPEWVYDAAADYPMNAVSYASASDPAYHREGRLFWGPTFQDPVSREYLVSVVKPLKFDGEHVSAFAHDIRVSQLMGASTKAEVAGLTHLIFREDGTLIAHPGRERQILASNGTYRMTDPAEPELAALFAAVQGRKERRFVGYDAVSENYFAAVRLAGPDWIYLTTLPGAVLRAQAFRSAQWVLWIGLGSLVPALLLLAVIFRNQIAAPLRELLRVTQRMAVGATDTQVAVPANNELGHLGTAFNRMARTVAERDAALRESERRWRLLFEQAPVGIAVFSPMGRLLRANRAHETLWGRSATTEDLRTDTRWLAAGFGPLIERAFAGETVALPAAPFALPAGNGDQETRWIAAKLYPVLDDVGEIEEIICLQEDVTERQRAEEQIRRLNQELERRVAERTADLSASEARVRTMLENAPEAIVVMDARTGRFVDFNRNALRFFALEPARLLELGPVDLSPERQPDGRLSAEIAAEMFALVGSGQPARFEWTHRRPDGSEIPCEIRLSRLPAKDRELVIGTILDISAHKQVEAELLKALDHERELGRLKGDFVSTVSHEFRTPLEIIMSSGEILDRYHDRLEPAQRSAHLRAIHDSVRRMDQLMGEVLLLSRVEAGKMPFTPAALDLAAVCRRIVDEILSATNHTHEIRFVATGVEAPAWSDENLLRHIFSNLLANAVKYSPPGAPVEFTVTRSGSDGTFTVRDIGCGIPPEDQDRVFQAFHRARNVRQISGTGLGLVIVKRCATLHGGAVRFRSREGEGTTFTVTLPLFRETTAEQRA